MYKFHVGDYVETINGEVGYLADFSTSDDYFIGTVNIKNGKYRNYQYSIYFNQFSKYFNQIGAYKFNSKIERLECNITDDHRIFNKINEIIDWINNHKE